MKIFKSKLVVGLMVLLALLFIVVGCSSDTETQSEAGEGTETQSNETEVNNNENSNSDPVRLRVGGAGTSTWVYGFVSSWAEVIQEDANVNLNVQSTAGSSAHYLMIENGEIDIASGFTPSEYYAERGEKNFEQQHEKFKALMPISEARGHIFTRAESTIETIQDLDGVRLGLGARGSPTSVVAEVQAEALGINAEYIYAAPGELMDMMRDGRIDAIWYYAGAPWSAVIDLSSQVDLKFIEFSEADIKTLQEVAPYTTQSEMTTEIYDFLDETITVPGAYQTLIISEDVPEDVAYNITKATWENWDKVVEVVPASGSVSVEGVTNLIGTLHPGALKYYQEIGAID
ncbi:TAXI family TRAP transporter solute-binding subunit [Alkalihalobacillus sp. BA299]|uniref:TAXI family TRAP transporter solute-binding subunit n=1 Tax=Alkalihalobacillus sp. BA299 TaxID=2815938 RepID=UPI001ADC32BA|nr:TAXI family TRAP transporter solute-binding subunit [Alkalihalobacillus sp. BA299]